MRNPSLVHLPFDSSKLTEGLDGVHILAVTLTDARGASDEEQWELPRAMTG